VSASVASKHVNYYNFESNKPNGNYNVDLLFLSDQRNYVKKWLLIFKGNSDFVKKINLDKSAEDYNRLFLSLSIFLKKHFNTSAVATILCNDSVQSVFYLENDNQVNKTVKRYLKLKNIEMDFVFKKDEKYQYYTDFLYPSQYHFYQIDIAEQLNFHKSSFIDLEKPQNMAYGFSFSKEDDCDLFINDVLKKGKSYLQDKSRAFTDFPVENCVNFAKTQIPVLQNIMNDIYVLVPISKCYGGTFIGWSIIE
jgi:hypothetical protein